MADGTEQVNRSAILYIVGSLGVVFSLLVVSMRTQNVTTETLLRLMGDRTDISDEQRAIAASRIRAAEEQIRALRDESDSLRGRLSMLEAKFMEHQSKEGRK